MNIFSHPRNHEAGFTLTEIMVAMAILLLVVAGVVTSHLFGMRMLEITRAKLGANDEARRALNHIVEEIRGAKLVRIGKGNATSFEEVEVEQPQLGSALQIHPTTDTNTFVRYFWDSEENQLQRTTHEAELSVVANSIGNRNIFAAEDHLGNILTNNQNNRVIALTLQFYQLQYPYVPVGEGSYYDFYQIRTRITRRALE